MLLDMGVSGIMLMVIGSVWHRARGRGFHNPIDGLAGCLFIEGRSHSGRKKFME